MISVSKIFRWFVLIYRCKLIPFWVTSNQFFHRTCFSDQRDLLPFEVYFLIWITDMFYGAVVWDPWLIVAQILCLQCLYYLTLGIFMAGLVGTRVSRISLVYFFDYASVTVSTITGWCVITSFILSSIAGWGFDFTHLWTFCRLVFLFLV